MKTLIGVCMVAMALVGNGCMGNAKHAESVSGGTTDSLYLLVGSYARAQEEGIRVYVFNQETGKGTFRSGLSGISNPSFLTPSADGSRVYAVGEDEGISSTANALSFDREKGMLSFINSQPTHGGAPCNITLSPKEDYVLTANYMGGNVTVFPLGSRGELLEGDTFAFTGSGPDKERQSQPHLHCVLLHRMVVCCLPMIWVLTVFMHFRSAKRKVRGCWTVRHLMMYNWLRESDHDIHALRQTGNMLTSLRNFRVMLSCFRTMK